MTDFVLKQKESDIINESQMDFYDEEFGTLKVIRNYANFLKQPLALWMFVPVSSSGEILKGKPLSPAPDSEWIRWENEEFEFYKAKERVLFEEFEVKDWSSDKDTISHTISLGGLFNVFWFDTVTQTWNPSIGVKNIEGLVNYGLILTETAKEEIFK